MRGNRTAIAANRRPADGHRGVCLRPRRWQRSPSRTTKISPWTAFLFLAPALAAQQLFSLYQEKARLYEEQLSLYDDLKVANTRLTRS